MIRHFLFLFVLSFGVALVSPAHSQPGGCDGLAPPSNCKLIDDFESGTPGDLPKSWRTTDSRDLVPLKQKVTSKQNVYVREDDGNQFARIYTDGTAFRVVRSHKQDLNWDVQRRPYLRWSWRAKGLPEGGNEKYDRSNDTGGAVYVTFSTDWLGRPKSIKYTYSSSLPVGTTVDYGPLQVLVVASKAEQGLDKWVTHERNVVEDYKRLFGDNPDNTPLALTMWSDSDTLEETATIDFDDILLLSQPSDSESPEASPE